MNRLIGILFLASLFIACDAKKDSELDVLVAKRDSLLTAIKELNIQIAELDTAKFEAKAMVSIDTLVVGKFEHFFEVQGLVEAKNNVMIVAETPAVIKKIHVKEGQYVSKGTLLVSLDNEYMRNQIDELNTRLKLAEFIYEKQSNLRDQNIGSELDYETALNNKESLESNLAAAKTQLEKTQITAPFDGVVDDIFPREGELAGPQSPMIRFVSLGNVTMNVDIPESYLSKIKKGDEVEVIFPDLGITHKSTIEQMGSFIQPLNRTFKILIDLPNDKNLLPNLIGVVRIRDYVQYEALIINQEDIMQDGEGRDFVFRAVESDGKFVAEKVFIEKGMTYMDKSQVIGGLDPDDKIVSKGARSIVDGETVHWEQ
jgi:RND family efflux transporter MFP subunit